MFKFLKKRMGVVCLFLWAWNVSAADYYFTNTSANFTNASAWSGSTVPTITDNAYFSNKVTGLIISFSTDVTNANAYFNAPNSSASQSNTLNIGSSTYWVTNSVVIGQALGATVTVNLASGNLVITNASRTASLTIGENGDGSFNLRGGNLIADHIYATNLTSGTPSSDFDLRNGSITTYGEVILSNGTISLGNAAGNFIWNMYGGTNYFNGTSSRLGDAVGSTSMVVVTGSGTIWSNKNSLNIGYDAVDCSLIITNGGKVFSEANSSSMADQATSMNNKLLVAGSGSEISFGGGFTAGSAGGGNQVVASNGGKMTFAGLFYLGSIAGAHSNKVVLTDAGSQILTTGELRIGNSGSWNQIIVSNNAYYLGQGATTLGNTAGSNTNSLDITGAGTLWSNLSIMVIGSTGTSNTMVLNRGAGVAVGNLTLGNNAGSGSNTLIISDAGTRFINMSAGTLRVGNAGSHNLLMVSNGAFLESGVANFGDTGGSTNNYAVVTGDGSRWNLTVLSLGTNGGSTQGLDSGLLIENGATLQVGTSITTGLNGSGNVSNRLGTYEFTTANPVITTNTVDSIILTNGILSYKGVTTANINTATVTRITFQGDNTFMLNNSTGILLSAYTFAPGNGANFQHLTMTEGGTRWQATNTTVNSGGQWLFSNTTATVFGVTTNNAGSIKLTSTNGASTTATFEQALVISGTGDGNGAIQHLRATNTIDAPITLMGNSTIHSVAGKLLLAGAITNGGNTLTLGGPGNITATAQISGTGGLTMNGGGSVILSNSAANTFSGATSITNTSVTLSKAGALGGTSGVTLSAAGTLLLSGAAGDRIANTAGLTMDGGTLVQGELSETMGTLTLKSNSTITLVYQNDGVNHDLSFDSGAYVGGTLTIDGWNTGPTGDGEERLYFTNDPGAGFLSNITFTGWGPGAKRLSNGYVIPSSAPEPGTVVGGALLVLLLGWRKINFLKLSS